VHHAADTAQDIPHADVAGFAGGCSSDRGGVAYWVHVWRPALTNSRTSRVVSQLGSQGSGNFNEQSERRRRWLLRLWAECPSGVPLWAVHFGCSELPRILLVTDLLVLRACQ